MTRTAEIPAGGYLIIHKGALDATGLPTLPDTSVVTYFWEDMPDLEALFGEEGGTILLKASLTNVDPDGTVIRTDALGVGLRLNLNTGFGDYRYDDDGDDVGNAGVGADATAVANDGLKDDMPPADAADASDPRDPAVDDLTITEIMWALNTANVGSGMEHDHQWIEIWNRNTAVDFPLKGIVLHLASGRAALSNADTVVVDAGIQRIRADDGDEMPARIVLDRVSNVVGAGWVNDVGSNGFDDGATAGTAAEEPFVSMYRKRGNDQIKKGTGSAKGHWLASTQVSFANHKGTPGKKERAGTKIFTTTTIPRSPVIFNEIANLSAADNEWIELRNVSDAEANLKNWQISIVTDNKTDTEYFNFFNADIKMAAGSVLLLVVSDPSDNDNHPLAAGFNIQKAADQQVDGVNADSARYLIMAKAEKDDNDTRGLKSAYAADATDPEGLPNNGEFVLILRSGLDKEGKADKLIDIAGYDTDLAVDEAGIFTGLWPLVNFAAPDKPNNALKSGIVQRRQFADIDGTKSKDKDQNDKTAFRDDDNGWTGIGYKRNADASKADQRWNTLVIRMIR